MIDVFYDGKCSICSKEINYYRKIAPKNIFNWEDITVDRLSLKKNNIIYVDALKKLHVIDANKKLHIGVDAFLIIWKNLKYWKILSILVSLPLIRQLFGIIYNIFAEYRFKNLKHCQIALRENNRY
tara:strand:- start:231 stop:608 length:378 start_codon:yes stop_codon:yes gene_type:complete